MAGGAILGTGITVDRNADWVEDPRVALAFRPESPRWRQEKDGWFAIDLGLDGGVHLMRLILSVLRANNQPVYDVNGDPLWLPPGDGS